MTTAAANSPIRRASGVTDSERRLQELAEKSFLKLWTYPRVFNDKGRSSTGQGQELCDLLVVFDRDILVFSDKACRFPASADIKIGWARWYRRAVLAGAKQVVGAQRWITQFPNRIFLDPQCRQRFPLKLPTKPRFHSIVVAHGAHEACRKHFKGGSGSLMVDTSIAGDEHTKGHKPFSVGWVMKSAGYIHILDDVTLGIVLRTLDTTPDFIGYLEKKNHLVSSKHPVVATGEEDILAYYLGKTNSGGEHDFVMDSNVTSVFFGEGLWANFSNSPQRAAQIEADDVSYHWDRLIDRFSKHMLGGTQYFPPTAALSENEICVRFMAAEPRLGRRALAERLVDALGQPQIGERFLRVMKLDERGPFYVFLILPKPPDDPEDSYRRVRVALLGDICRVVRHRYPKALDIVGIATQPVSAPWCSEDIIYMDGRAWTNAEQEEAAKLATDYEILANPKQFEINVQEYPPQPVRRFGVGATRIPRNDLCPCGSGRKYKKCCLR